MGVSLSEVPVGEVEEELVRLSGQMSSGLCRWLLLLGELDRREGWGGFGIQSCSHWLSIRLGIAPSTSRAYLGVAHALVGLPLVTEEFAAGRLGYSQVRALCRVADATNEAELVRLARLMNGGQLERMCLELRGLDEQAESQVAERTSLTVRWNEDGTATVRCRVPTEDAAMIAAAIEERVLKLDLPSTVPWEARRAEAPVGLVADGAQVTNPHRTQPLVHIVIPLADLEAAKGGMIDGRPIADSTIRRMLCDGSVVAVVVDEHGKPVAVGNKTRVVGTKTRRCVDVRDGKLCTFPGCSRPAEEIHHVRHWVVWKLTEVDLLTGQCRWHHREHHRGRFNMDIDPETGLVRFSRPDGSVILARVPTKGAASDIPGRFPVAEGTVPCRWEGDPLVTTELTPPAKEAAEPTSLRFGFHQRAKTTAARIARTLSCRFEPENDLWVTSDPELITITPEPAGGCLIRVELTTRPHQLTVTLGAIGIEPIRPYNPESPQRPRRLT